MCQGFAKKHVARQAQHKRHMRQICFEGVGADFLRRVAFFNMTVSARWFRCLSGRWIENRQRDSWGDRQTDGHIHLIDKQNQTDR